MHELGHAAYGHEGVSGKQELLANRWAAHRLLTLDAVRESAGLGLSMGEVAGSLDVLPEVLKTYLQLLTLKQLSAVRESALVRAS